MLISIPSTSLVLQTFYFIFLLIIFPYFFIFDSFWFSLYSLVPLGCMRRLGVENLIPLDLEIEETLRKIKKDKRATT